MLLQSANNACRLPAPRLPKTIGTMTLLSSCCLFLGTAQSQSFTFDRNSNEAWRNRGFYDDGGLTTIRGHFSDIPAVFDTTKNSPDPIGEGFGSLRIGSDDLIMPASPSGSSVVHWDLVSPSLEGNTSWQDIRSFSYDVLGYVSSSAANWVQAVVHVQKPGGAESYFSDGTFHPVPVVKHGVAPEWQTHEIDLSSLGIPNNSNVLDVSLRFFFEPEKAYDGYIYLDNVIPVEDIEYRSTFTDVNAKGIGTGSNPTSDVDFEITNGTSVTWTDFHVQLGGTLGTPYFLANSYEGPGTVGLNANSSQIDIFGLSVPPGNRFKFSVDIFSLEVWVAEGYPTAVAPLPSDLNGDGNVDAADAGLMFANWGGSGLGDLVTDGIVDAADAGVMFAAWTGDPALASVPEPHSLSVLLVTLCWCVRCPPELGKARNRVDPSCRSTRFHNR